ncbi:MAG: hypothetical protein JNM93_13235 [Bacteriovoracaceae bacterium]|nr:hypothetical protein [Bacteriovoracaceae bacterium]
MLKYLYAFLLLPFFLACTPEGEVLVEQEIEKAKLSLTTKNCASAITILTNLGNQPENPKYLAALASAYACRAGFDERVLFLNDIALLDASSNDTVIGSITLFSTSPETIADSATYTDLQLGINTLLYAGGVTEPSSAARELIFGTKHNNDLNLQALYMLLAQVGKYFYLYGDADGTGLKGGGAGNNCLYSYTDPIAQLAIDSVAGDSCDSSETGHPDLNAAPGDADSLRRVCEGYVLLTNLLDVMENTTFPAATDLGDINTSLVGVVNQLKNTPGQYCQDPALPAGICDERSQSDCETFYAVPANFDLMQRFFAAVLETIFI